MDVRRTALCSVAVTGIVLALVAGCGGPSEQVGGGVSTSSSGPSTSPSGQVGSMSPSPSSGPPRTGGATPPPSGKVTVRGRVEEGVELGCVVLRADDGVVWLLIGADPAIARPGARVEVVGDARIDMVTTCMQGTPLAVAQIRRI